MLLCYQTKNTENDISSRIGFNAWEKNLKWKMQQYFFSGVIFSLETAHPLSIYTKIETMRFIYYIFYTINCHNYHPHYIKSNHCLNFNKIMRWMSALKRPFLHKFTFFRSFFRLSQNCLDLFCSLYERSILI